MFISKKKLMRNNEILFKRNSDLNNYCVDLQIQLKNINEKNVELENEIVIISEKLEDKKKECKKLKTLLTKNKIEYRKEN